MRFTIEPVTSVLPKGAVAACIIISNAARTAVLVIHKIFLFIICTPL
jgi:hypothetical protein